MDLVCPRTPKAHASGLPSTPPSRPRAATVLSSPSQPQANLPALPRPMLSPPGPRSFTQQSPTAGRPVPAPPPPTATSSSCVRFAAASGSHSLRRVASLASDSFPTGSRLPTLSPISPTARRPGAAAGDANDTISTGSALCTTSRSRNTNGSLTAVGSWYRDADAAYGNIASAGAIDDPTLMMSLSLTLNVEYCDRTGDLLRVNDINVLYEVGAGAYGTVYAAECPRYEGALALKALPRRKTDRAPSKPRLVRTCTSTSTQLGDSFFTTFTDVVHEADVMSRLCHENVVKIHEAIDDPASSVVFLVMEFVDGKPAGSVTGAKPGATRFACTTLPEAEQRVVARDVAAALAYCEAQGVVHGDVKPENILLEIGRSQQRAKLADFGVATEFDRAEATCLALRSPKNAGSTSRTNTNIYNLPSPVARMPSCGSLESCDAASTSSELPTPLAAGSASFARLPRLRSYTITTSNNNNNAKNASGAHQDAVHETDAAERRRRRARGTPAFLAPELLTGSQAAPTPATDAWALGVTFYGLRYGELPFGGATRGELVDSVSTCAVVFPSPDGASASEVLWQRIILRLLEKDPNARGSVAEITDLLLALPTQDGDVSEGTIQTAT